MTSAEEQGRERAAFMLEDEARHVRVVTGQNELHQPTTNSFDRPQQVFEYVRIVDADLQHDAARHAGGLVAPRAQIDLAEPVTTDIGLGIDQLAEGSLVDLVTNPAKLNLPPPLIAEPQQDAGFGASLRDGTPFRHRIGDWLVEEHMLAGGRGRARGGKMCVIGGRIDDRLDRRISENLLVARRVAAAVLGGKGRTLIDRARVAGDDLKLAGAHNGVGQHVRPPSHTDACNAQRHLHHPVQLLCR